MMFSVDENLGLPTRRFPWLCLCSVPWLNVAADRDSRLPVYIACSADWYTRSLEFALSMKVVFKCSTFRRPFNWNTSRRVTGKSFTYDSNPYISFALMTASQVNSVRLNSPMPPEKVKFVMYHHTVRVSLVNFFAAVRFVV